MTSKVQIFNEALTHLKAARIRLETEPRGLDLEAVWESSLDATLEAHPWNFATFRATRAAMSDAPAFGYDYQYQLPNDPRCLRVLQIDDDANATFVTEGRKILTDVAAPLKIKYIGRVTDTNQYPAQFQAALALLLASKTAGKINGSTTLGERLFARFEDAIAAAKSTDAMEGGDEVALADADSEFIGAIEGG